MQERKIQRGKFESLKLGSCDVYCSTREHFSQMEFIDVTGDIDASYTSLDRGYTPPMQKIRKPSRTSEEDVKLNSGNHYLHL